MSTKEQLTQELSNLGIINGLSGKSKDQLEDLINKIWWDAYWTFDTQKRPKVEEKHPEMSYHKVSQKLDRRWKRMSIDKQKTYMMIPKVPKKGTLEAYLNDALNDSSKKPVVYESDDYVLPFYLPLY